MEPQYPEPWYEVTVRYRATNHEQAQRMRAYIINALEREEDGVPVFLFTHMFQCPAWLSRALSQRLTEEDAS